MIICVDIGCDNFVKAENSRWKIKHKLFIQAYLEAESVLDHTPMGKSLPSWIPQNFEYLYRNARKED